MTHTWWTLDNERVAQQIATDPADGLASAEAQQRLNDHGPNELVTEPPRSPLLLFASQFANTMIVVLLVAAALTVAIGDRKDAIVIGAIVILNAGIGFFQEYRAERAIEALKRMTSPETRVVRDGQERTISATGLVPGDVVVLESGSVVPADIRLIEAPSLRVDEAALTGESVPVDKSTTALDPRAAAQIADRTNMVFNGTSVVHGRARGIVVETAMRTELGQIAGLLKSHQSPRTPLQRRLAALGIRLAIASIAVCIVVFTAGVLRGEGVRLMLLTAISLAVAAIPESLPAVVTISLALGASRMIHKGALIRKLPAVETLGSVTVICTDKTGTLTQGRMQVEKVWTLAGELAVSGDGYNPTGDLTLDGDQWRPTEGHPATRLLLVAALCNDASLAPPADAEQLWSVVGDPTEGALLALAGKAGLDIGGLQNTYPRKAEIAFDSDRKRMSTAHAHRGQGPGVIATKGGIEAILDVSSSAATSSGDQPLTDEIRTAFIDRATALAGEGFRVLATAGRPLQDHDLADLEKGEAGLTLYGLVAMADPARPESAAAVAACKAAGIIPVMITGDHPATGRAIATQLDILGTRRIITGQTLSDDLGDALAEQVEDIAVYARTSPEQKLDIVRAWKQRGHVVAMTGDGVNDAPALRAADIGVAMGISGTEVAKEAAEMVLTDDNFATILDAVGEGRRIYDNIRRFVRYTLTSNSAEIWVMFLGPIFGLPLPLLPVHILWINLVTDGLPGLALGVEPAERNVMTRPPRPPDEGVFARGLWQHVVVVGLLMGLIPLGLGIWGEAGDRPWQTMVFTSLALLQLGHALAVRSELDSMWSLGLATNRALLVAVVGTAALQIGAVLWAPARDLLSLEALSLFELAVVLVASTGAFWIVEIEKMLRRRTPRHATS